MGTFKRMAKRLFDAEDEIKTFRKTLDHKTDRIKHLEHTNNVWADRTAKANSVLTAVRDRWGGEDDVIFEMVDSYLKGTTK